MNYDVTPTLDAEATADDTAVNRIDALRGKLSDVEKQSLITLALDVLADMHRPGQTLTSPSATQAYLRLQLGDRKAEVFGSVFLDNRHRVIGMTELFQGTIDGATVHPRVVAQQALKVNAAAIIFYHNHPSGVAEPSRADQMITGRLKDAMALVDVQVLDHFVVARESSVSLAERGLI
jgi:DNA repair protein RadC